MERLIDVGIGAGGALAVAFICWIANKVWKRYRRDDVKEETDCRPLKEMPDLASRFHERGITDGLTPESYGLEVTLRKVGPSRVRDVVCSFTLDGAEAPHGGLFDAPDGKVWRMTVSGKQVAMRGNLMDKGDQVVYRLLLDGKPKLPIVPDVRFEMNSF